MSKLDNLNHGAQAALVILSYPVAGNAVKGDESATGETSRCLSGTILELLAEFHRAWVARPFISR